MHPFIEARGVAKRYGDVEALAGIDLEAHPGEVLAVLGPSGAGKTTFVRSVATLVRPDEGELRVCGVDALTHSREVRRVIGLAGQFAAVEPSMTGHENLVLVGRLYGHGRRTAAAAAARVLDQLGLADAGDRQVSTYSGGMRRRLDLGATLVGAPRLLLLDEPTTGLDPHSRNQLWAAIRELVDQGTDVLLTTQYLEEADQLASRVVVIGEGRVLAEGTPAGLKRRFGQEVVDISVREDRDVAALAGVLSSVGEPRVDNGRNRVTVPVDQGRAAMGAAMRALDDAGIEVDEIALRGPTLDEVFLAITGSGTAA